MASGYMQYTQADKVDTESKPVKYDRTFLAENIEEVEACVRTILAEEPNRTLVSGSIRWTNTQKIPDPLSLAEPIPDPLGR